MLQNQREHLRSDSVSQTYRLKQVARPFTTAVVIAKRIRKLNWLQIYRHPWRLVELFDIMIFIDSYIMVLQTIRPLVAMLRTTHPAACFEGLPRSCLDRTSRRHLAFLQAAIAVAAGLRRTIQLTDSRLVYHQINRIHRLAVLRNLKFTVLQSLMFAAAD